MRRSLAKYTPRSCSLPKCAPFRGVALSEQRRNFQAMTTCIVKTTRGVYTTCKNEAQMSPGKNCVRTCVDVGKTHAGTPENTDRHSYVRNQTGRAENCSTANSATVDWLASLARGGVDRACARPTERMRTFTKPHDRSLMTDST